jgi:sugar/nucleoside kinase (ribokinase family)
LLGGSSNEEAAKFGCFLASRGVTVFGPRLQREDYLKYQKEFNSL